MKYKNKTYTDGVVVHLKGKRFFKNKPTKNTDTVSFKAAKDFALYVLYTHLSEFGKK
jgi:hypothetical protein